MSETIPIIPEAIPVIPEAISVTPEAMPITPEVVTWARERAGFSVDTAATDFRKIAEWEAGETFPDYLQLERMAEKFRVPVAVFFFPAPPDLPSIEETFHTLEPDRIAKIPPRIRLLIRKAQTFRMGLEELHDGRNPVVRLITRDFPFHPTNQSSATPGLAFHLKDQSPDTPGLAFLPTDRINHIAMEIRACLGVTMEQQFAWSDADTALEKWRGMFQDVGVYVFKDQFREPNYSGFSLYDDEFPIIYVNNTTEKTRQIFTLFHELAHLLFHTSGFDMIGDELPEKPAEDSSRIEVICNRIAHCILVPEETFDATFAGQEPNEATAVGLARLFNVSREFIFRRFLDRELITPDEYDQAVRCQAKQEQRCTGEEDYYNTKIACLGTEYINLAFQRFYQNRIDYNKLADILDTAPRKLTRLEEYVSRRLFNPENMYFSFSISDKNS